MSNEVEKAEPVNQDLDPEGEVGSGERRGRIMHSEVSRFLGMVHSPGDVRGSDIGKIFEKFEPEHVGKWIDNVDKEDKRAFTLRLMDRIFSGLYIILGAGVLIAAALYFYPKDPQVFMDILKIIVAFAGGAGAGYGIGKKKKEE